VHSLSSDDQRDSGTSRLSRWLPVALVPDFLSSTSAAPTTLGLNMLEKLDFNLYTVIMTTDFKIFPKKKKSVKLFKSK
jgi:hypothetical protein